MNIRTNLNDYRYKAPTQKPIKNSNFIGSNVQPQVLKQQNRNPNVNQVISFVGKKVQESLDTLRLIYSVDTHRRINKMPHLKTAIDEAKNTTQHSLTVNSGDYGNGSKKLDLQVDFLNKMGIDFATLGNHEFMSGMAQLSKTINKANFQTVVSNMIAPPTNVLTGLMRRNKIVPSAVKEINGVKYGILGAVPEELNDFRRFTKNATVLDTKKVITEKVKEFESQGINRIIVLSHQGPEADKELAKIAGVDIVAGGHEHLAYPGIKEGVNLFHNTRENGTSEPSLILHGGAHNKYLGVSDLVFNQNGVLQVKADPSPIRKFFNTIFNIKTTQTTSNKLMDLNTFIPDPEVQKMVEIEEKGMHTIANLKHEIKFKFPIWQSTEIGSLIADAIKDYANTQPDDNTPKAEIALVQAGCFKRGLDKGSLTAEFIQDFVMPFTPHIVKTKITGQDIIDSLNGTANSIHSINDIGIMQVSGLKYNIDVKKPEGQRVDPKSVLVERNGIYEAIDPSKEYITVYDNFLRSGQEVFHSLANGELINEYRHGNSVGLINYIEKHKNDDHIGDKNYKQRINVINMPKEPLSIKKILSWFGIKQKEFIIECEA